MGLRAAGVVLTGVLIARSPLSALLGFWPNAVRARHVRRAQLVVFTYQSDFVRVTALTGCQHKPRRSRRLCGPGCVKHNGQASQNTGGRWRRETDATALTFRFSPGGARNQLQPLVEPQPSQM
ncbi:hypothetical protein SALBM311S_00316 [Streptomyces alboniger]